MTHDKPIERSFLAENLGIMFLSILAAGRLHAVLVRLIPGLKAPVPVEAYVPLLLIFVPVWFWISERAGLHLVRTLMGPPLDIVRKLMWTQAGAIVAIGVILTAAQVTLNRTLIALFLCISTFSLLLLMIVQRRWVRRHYGEAVALVVGPAQPDLLREVESARRRRVDRLESTSPDDLRRRFREGPIDEVVLSSDIPRDTLHGLVGVCQEVGIPALVWLERVDLDLVRPAAEVIGRGLYLNYHRREPARPSLVVKGFMDRVGALIGILLSLPIQILIALLVRAKMGKPIFFVQERAGLNGRPFPMIKFRTMRVGAESERIALLSKNEMDGPVFKIKDDPRVPPIGRFLRASSLDELPQLFNVLLGHMSLIGPRPLPLVETGALDGAHRRRLSMRPGITGLWQVSGRNDIPFSEWMALDLAYVDDWSLGLDLSILLRTLPAVITRKGAH
jgi:exopolysaccharide biosynthesis polyprenyl glycosylphosphotransferase